MLGGVCSGVAAFFGWDSTAVRLIIVLLALFSGFGVVLYIIMWLLVPEAKTAEQQLEMRGEPITLENIGKVLSANSKAVGKDISDAYQKVDNNGCISTFLKICLIGLGVIVGVPILFALVIVIFTLLTVVLGVGTGFLGGFLPWTYDTSLLVERPELATIGLCLLIGIPLVSILYSIVSVIFKWKPVYKAVKIIGLVLWLLSFILVGCSGWKADWHKFRYKDNRHIGFSNFWFNDNIRGDGNIIKDTSTYSNFINEIEFYNGIDYELEIDTVADNKLDMIIEGDSNILDRLVININVNKVQIMSRGNVSLIPTKPLKVKLQTDKLRTIAIKGSSNISVPDGFKTDNIMINIDGSGNIEVFKLTAERLLVDIRGSGDASIFAACKKSSVNILGSGSVNLNGKSALSDFKTKGSGDIFASDFLCDTLTVQTTGSGDVHCNALGLIKINITGSGDVYYKNDVRIENVNSTGSGSVKKE
jgi:phage shock protein PspC (stress-responsive transcriptional regulator)